MCGLTEAFAGSVGEVLTFTPRLGWRGVEVTHLISLPLIQDELLSHWAVTIPQVAAAYERATHAIHRLHVWRPYVLADGFLFTLRVITVIKDRISDSRPSCSIIPTSICPCRSHRVRIQAPVYLDWEENSLLPRCRIIWGKSMKPIQMQVTVSLDEQGANTIVELIHRAIATEVGFNPQSNARLNASQHALFAGQKPPEDRGLLVDTNQVANLLKVCRKTIWTMQTQGRMPKPIRIGSAVRWSYEEIKAWVDAGCPKETEWKKIWPKITCSNSDSATH